MMHAKAAARRDLMDAGRRTAASGGAGRARTPAQYRAVRRPSRPTGAVQVLAFRTQLTDRMLDASRRYAELTGRAGSLTRDELRSELLPLVGNGIKFVADGVIYPKDRSKSLGELVDSLARQHAAYEHVVYKPVVSAVNEDAGVVFTAVFYVLRNTGPVFGAKEPTGRLSKGLLIDKLTFDRATGQFQSSLVVRQMTLEERDAILLTPTAWSPKAVEEADVTAVPAVVAGPNDLKYMSEQIQKWSDVWNTGSSLDPLNTILDPSCRCFDGYGLAAKPGGLLWQGIDGAKASAQAEHEAFDNKEQLVAHAVSEKHKLGFLHWRSDATSKPGGRPMPMQGIELILFNEHLQLRDIYDFTMRPSTNLVVQAS